MHNRKLPGVVDYGLSNSLRLSRSLNNTINTFGHINSKRINIASGSSPSLSVSPNSLISTLGIGVRLPSRYNSSPNSGDSDGIKDKLNKAGRTRKSHTIRKVILLYGFLLVALFIFKEFYLVIIYIYLEFVVFSKS